MASDDATPASPARRNFIDVSAGLVFRNGQLLITRRYPEAHLGGLWEFPGGKRDVDESDEACLKRELMEELGIEVAISELLATIKYEYPEKSVNLKFFRCKWLRNEPAVLGCHAFAWITREQLASYNFPAADAQLLDSLTTSSELWS